MAGQEGLVLQMLRDDGPLPRSELARRSGVSAATMTRLVARLREDGSVAETTLNGAEPSVGRPAANVALVDTAFHVVGIQDVPGTEMGTGRVQITICDLRARVVRRTDLPYDVAHGAPAQMIERVGQAVDALIAESGIARSRFLGIGVVAPGPVDPARRRILLSIRHGWRDVPFAQMLEAAVGLPVVVEHNARAMALAETRYGIGREADVLLYVYARTGLGSGVIVHGEPFRLGTYGITELGHIRVVEKGLVCACGSTGCLETVVSEPYLAGRIMEAGGDPTRLMAEIEGRPAIREPMIEHLTTALASAVNLLNCDLILLGGIFSDTSDTLLTRIADALRPKVLPILRDAVRVGRSTLGVDGGVRGAAAAALDAFFYSPEGVSR